MVAEVIFTSFALSVFALYLFLKSEGIIGTNKEIKRQYNYTDSYMLRIIKCLENDEFNIEWLCSGRHYSYDFS